MPNSRPVHAEARFDLASELYAQQRHAEVLPLVERPIQPIRAGQYLGLKAQALRLHGRNAEAITDAPGGGGSQGNAKLRLLYGHLLREVGEQAEAIGPTARGSPCSRGWARPMGLANLKTVRFSETDHAAMQQQLALSAPLAANRATWSSHWAKPWRMPAGMPSRSASPPRQGG